MLVILFGVSVNKKSEGLSAMAIRHQIQANIQYSGTYILFLFLEKENYKHFYKSLQLKYLSKHLRQYFIRKIKLEIFIIFIIYYFIKLHSHDLKNW